MVAVAVSAATAVLTAIVVESLLIMITLQDRQAGVYSTLP